MATSESEQGYVRNVYDECLFAIDANSVKKLSARTSDPERQIWFEFAESRSADGIVPVEAFVQGPR